MSDYVVWLILAAFIITVLAFVAGRLLWRLHLQTKQEKAALQVAERESVVEQVEARNGIVILARCYLGGQLGASELALRVAVLTETAALDTSYAQDTTVFTEMAAALAHIPTHQAWKDLSAEQRANYGAEMALLEGSYSDRVRAAAEALVGESHRLH